MKMEIVKKVVVENLILTIWASVVQLLIGKVWNVNVIHKVNPPEVRLSGGFLG